LTEVQAHVHGAFSLPRASNATEWEIGIVTGGIVKSCPCYEIQAVRIVDAP
jgi:hypothetical protein